MYHLSLPPLTDRRVSFYLATEEYVAREKRNEQELFFTWQVKPSVIFGRHQDIRREVNLDYCRKNGVETFRRKSGGGCVYADMGNLMLTYIATGDNNQFVYHQYTTMMVGALRHLGIDASATGRNDILVDGGKVSGTAFYQMPGRAIVHGTLLYDTDMRHMSNCLTPDNEKLSSKGVRSVSQRITLLKEHTTLTLDEIRDGLTGFLCRGTVALQTDDLSRIEALERQYLSETFIMGRKNEEMSSARAKGQSQEVVRRRRMEGVGTLEARITLTNGRIDDIQWEGDFFQTGDLKELNRRLTGASLTRGDLLSRLPDDLSHIIAGLKAEALAGMMEGGNGEEPDSHS